jgi:hypothetical protein
MIFRGGFSGEGVRVGTQDPGLEMQDQWAQRLDWADIDGERLFSTEPT